MTTAPRPPAGKVAFVLGGGGVLGAVHVGMMRALFERRILPDLVVGTSIGAINGAYIAGNPTADGIEELRDRWERAARGREFLENPLRQAQRMVKHRTHFMSMDPLRRLLESTASVERIEDLRVPFQCVAACIETAGATWFTQGPIIPAVLASCAVPGMFEPVEIGGRHYLDGGLVHSIPVGRAVELGATRIYVLQVGRIEQPLAVPRKAWQVATVAFEIARRHRYVEEIEQIPDSIEVHVLPSGMLSVPAVSGAYSRPRTLIKRIDAARDATRAYLDGLP